MALSEPVYPSLQHAVLSLGTLEEETDLRRFIVTYRWELWLIGIPCAAAVAGDWALSSALAAVLLAGSYVRIRRLDRDLLPVVCGYFLASAVIAASAATAPAALRDGLLPSSWVDLLDPPWFRPWLPFWPAMLAELMALLWFARRASRLSLSHALFLVGFMFIPITHVVYTLFVNLDVSPVQPSHSSDVALMYVFLAFTVASTAAALLRVWLLGSFDLRGSVFRRNAVAAHLAVGITLPLAAFAAFYVVSASFYVLLVLSTLVLWAGIVALAYLVRVRHPAVSTHIQRSAERRAL